MIPLIRIDYWMCRRKEQTWTWDVRRRRKGVVHASIATTARVGEVLCIILCRTHGYATFPPSGNAIEVK